MVFIAQVYPATRHSKLLTQTQTSLITHLIILPFLFFSVSRSTPVILERKRASKEAVNALNLLGKHHREAELSVCAG